VHGVRSPQRVLVHGTGTGTGTAGGAGQSHAARREPSDPGKGKWAGRSILPAGDVY